MITVVLPVHNGGVFLRRCIESLARQDCAPGSFELIVLENASTDGALDALRLLPAAVPHRIVASDQLLSIEQNWARIAELKDTREYMTTIGHDDAYDPTFIRVVTQALMSGGPTDLLLTHFRLIDEHDRIIRPCHSMAPHETIGDFVSGRLLGRRDSFGTGYVFRSKDYRAVGGIPSYPKLMYADDALWVMLARSSGIQILREEHFSYRLHAHNTSRVVEGDAEPMYRAYERYLSLLEAQADHDDGLCHALAAYGPSFVRRLAGHWMLLESNHANRMRRAVRADLVDGWQHVIRRMDKFAGASGAGGLLSPEIDFSLWANRHPLSRLLWSSRPLRVMMRTARRSLSRRPA